MKANLIYFIGIAVLLLGTFLTYYGSHLKSEEGTNKLNSAITKKDRLIDNLNLQVTDLRVEQEKLLLLQEAPTINILPHDNVKGKDGIFHLSIVNTGLSDIVGLEIYEDYFVAIGSKEIPVKLYRFGSFITKPNSNIPSLPKGKTENFSISYKTIKDKMNEFYLNKDIKGQRMMIARLKINVVRKIDGKKFSYSKAYIIAAGDFLFDYDTSRDIKTEMDFYTFDDIKQILGVTL